MPLNDGLGALQPLRETLLLNTDLVVNCLRDLSPEETASTPVKDGSSVAFLLAHLLHARYYVLELLGAPLDNPHSQAFDAVSSGMYFHPRKFTRRIHGC